MYPAMIFVMELRINNACQLLINTDLNVNEICYKSGYNNFSNFIRQFKKLKIKVEDIEINVKIIESQKLKAIVGLDFGDFKIKGFRVNISDYENARGEKLWVTPPSYRDGNGRYHPIFYAPNKELWELIQFRILDEYHKTEDKYYKKRFDLKDDI